ncbi:MAG: Tat pathway signal protein [Spirochaetaceae bacterium]|nr:MAG: Tat pathway signal protein [Spirochaetaceae bacterium]
MPGKATSRKPGRYADAVRSIWRHSDGVESRESVQRNDTVPLDEAARQNGAISQNEDAIRRDIVRYATLAPSGHNAQCWRFQIEDHCISILPDLSRRTPVVDPDDHHLYVSLGCAAENLVLAAQVYGFDGALRFSSASDGVVSVSLIRSSAIRPASPLFQAIPYRQCTRAEYDGRPLGSEELRLLQAAGTGSGVAPILLTGHESIEKVLESAVQGNTMQISNPAFVDELEHWIRFSDAEAVRTGDGLPSRATGNPPVPRWLGRRLFRMLFRPQPENDRLARHIRSSAGIALFVSNVDDRAHQVEAGRCYQRFALQATALGIRNAFINQPVEEPALRREFARAFAPADGRPNLVVRFGRGQKMPRSLRRPLEAVLL